MPHSPKVTRVPPLAGPERFGWCCLRCLTRRGISIGQLSSGVVGVGSAAWLSAAGVARSTGAVAGSEPAAGVAVDGLGGVWLAADWLAGDSGGPPAIVGAPPSTVPPLRRGAG